MLIQIQQTYINNSQIKKLMSAVKGSRNSPRPVYSHLTVENDQKDIMINQLKQQVFHLKKNQSEFYKLEDQYKSLEHKYRILIEEKRISDIDFSERHQMAIRNICALRNQLEALKSDLREQCLEKDDLETDNATLRSLIDQRLIEIEKLRSEINSIYADGDELEGERQRLIYTATGLKQDQQSLLGRVRNLQSEIDSVLRKNEELEKYQKKQTNQQIHLKDKILNYERQNNQMDEDINQVIDDLHNFDNNITNSGSDIKDLQTEIAEINALCDKYKSEALHYHKACQGELMKNNELTKVLSQSENTMRVRINQTEQGKNEIKALKAQISEVEQVNTRLEDDIENCRRHLENLGLLNSDLVHHLEKFSEEDNVVRNIIDRKARVEKARFVVNQAVNYNKNLMGTGETRLSYENINTSNYQTFDRTSRFRY